MIFNRPGKRYLKGRKALFAMPAEAGIQSPQHRIFWIPAPRLRGDMLHAGKTVIIETDFPNTNLFMFS